MYKIAFFDTHQFEKNIFEITNAQFQFAIDFFEHRLTEKTVDLVKGYDCICAFVNDKLDRSILVQMKKNGVQLVALRSAGYNHVDLIAAKEFGIKIVRVPEYSPYSVAEHAVALILTLNRKTHRSFNRVREGNFSLNGLIGFDLHQKTVGVIGTGRIGKAFCQIMHGFGCQVIAYDLKPDSELQSLGVQYTDLTALAAQSDIISLHVPLNEKTKHIVDSAFLEKTKKGFMLINTSRGGLVDTKSLIQFLKNNHIGYAGLDVYEEEAGIFFENLSEQILQDDELARLMTFPNVLITSHQGFLTQEALTNIAQTTLSNIHDYQQGLHLNNEVL